jgi:hypothetical protein
MTNQLSTEQVSELSADNLTKAIAELVYPKYRCTRFGDSASVNLYTFYAHTNDKNNYVKTVDYCNNWNDLMPLVVKYSDRIGFILGLRDVNFYHFMCDEENPQRKLAECLLLALQELRNKAKDNG